MEQTDDPRICFAAERTLLAWSRTGLAMMGLGFVVARFGLFLQMMRHPDAIPVQHGASIGIGMSLVVLGTLVNILSGIQFFKFMKTLDRCNVPREYRVYMGLITTVSLALIGIALAAYLYA